jgi:phospholipid/cholesterol/gamma-HCH transport system substrate-binding protein
MSPRFTKSFAERNLRILAVLGSLILVAVFALTYFSESLPVIGLGNSYSARFAESGGIRAGNEVRVAGVKVGKVTSVHLDGDSVLIDFRLKGVHLGQDTTASVKVKTLLGQKYLAIDPLGTGTLHGTIPEDHTTTPFDVNAALSGLATTFGQIDTAQLERSFDVLSNTFAKTPASVRKAISGLTALSRTISSRDGELATLFKATKQVTGTLASRNAEFASLLKDGDSLLSELQQRRDAVHAMFVGSARLGQQVRGLVADNNAQLRPALTQLDRLSTILQRNQSNLDAALKRLGPYYKVLDSAMGNGRWVDAYVCGLFDTNGAPLLKNDVVRNCHPKSGGGR